MKVHELIEVLKTYPQDAPVVALWDSGWSKIEVHSLEEDDEGHEVVEFDVTEWGTYQE